MLTVSVRSQVSFGLAAVAMARPLPLGKADPVTASSTSDEAAVPGLGALPEMRKVYQRAKSVIQRAVRKKDSRPASHLAPTLQTGLFCADLSMPNRLLPSIRQLALNVYFRSKVYAPLA